MLDTVLQEKRIPDLIKVLEKMDEDASLLTLERRDHIFSFLEMWDIYFAVQMTSIDILRILGENNITQDPQVFMVDFIRDLANSKDSRFSQFCINVNTISRGMYVILVPSILDQRIEELTSCKIRFKDTPTSLYCTAELNDTYYGHKILSALHGYSAYDIVVNQEQFSVIYESLTEAELDIASMLVKLDADDWDAYVGERRRPLPVRHDVRRHGTAQQWHPLCHRHDVRGRLVHPDPELVDRHSGFVPVQPHRRRREHQWRRCAQLRHDDDRC